MRCLKFVMTTTFYPPYHLGGDAVHVYNLSNELAKLGHEVHIIHSIDSYYMKRKKKVTDRYENHRNVTVHSLKSPIGKTSPLISYVFGSPYPLEKEIKRLIDEIKPDVLHHHNVAGFGPFIFEMKAPKILYTAHDYWLACPMSGLTRYDQTYCTSNSNCFMCTVRSHRPPQLWRYAHHYKRSLSNISTIICPSDFMGNKLKELGIRSNFATIPNFVIKPPESKLSLYNFSYLLFVGVLEKHKGILNLIDSFIRISDRLDSKLLIVGTGSLKEKIESIIISSGCNDKIIMLGRVSDSVLSCIYAHADAVIIPSIWPENNPLVALESLANGTPVIVSNKGGLPEIIRQHKYGIIYKGEDEKENNSLINIMLQYKEKLNFTDFDQEGLFFDRYFEKYYKLIC